MARIILKNHIRAESDAESSTISQGYSKKVAITSAAAATKPACYCCPLTRKIMEDPVMDLCAHNFERVAIVEWLRAGNRCCPISRKPLREEDLVSNDTLGELIDRWRWRQEYSHEGGLKKEIDSICGFRDKDEDTESISDTEGSTDGSSQGTNDGSSVIGVNKKKDEKGTKNNDLQIENIDLHHVDLGMIPDSLLLLPQERQVLVQVRLQAQISRRLRRRRLQIQAAVGLIIVTIVLTFVLSIFRHVMTFTVTGKTASGILS